VPVIAEPGEAYLSDEEIDRKIRDLEAEMLNAARNLEFEKASVLRDQFLAMKERLIGVQAIKK